MNPLKVLLVMLLAFLRPAVDDQDPANPNPDPDPDPDPQPDLDLEGADPEPDPKDAPDPNAELEAARRESAENKARAERFEREAAELRVRQQPAPQDDEFSREEARLKDPATPDLEKWQIKANRELRANRNAAQAALAQAHDVSDRTAFASVAISNPLAKKYEARVEEALAKARQNGQFPRREDIFKYMLGQDMLDGKFKKKAAPTADPSKVNRGKLPGAKSDVSGKGAASEREKRAARLANVQI